MDKALDKVEAGVASARNKIDTIGEKAKEQYQNWKRVLSGALNDPQLILGLSILFCMYVILTAFNSFLVDTSKRDNASTCECPIFHRVVYRSVLIIGILIWFVGFVIITIWDAYKFWRFEDRARHPNKYQAKISSQSSETQEQATTFLERTIDSVEAGAQAVMKIPVKSMFTKTLDIIEDGAETLHVIDDGVKQLKENPVNTILTKTMESVNDAVSDKLKDGNTETDDDDESKPSMLQNATELIDMARQDSILGKLVKPIDEKVVAAKQTTAGSKLTDLVTSSAKMVQEDPADLMLTKAMEVVDDKTQPNQASSMLAKSVEFVAAIKENPSEALLAASVGVADNIISSQLQNSNETKQKATESMFTTALDLAEAGMEAAREDPAELLSSRAVEQAVSAVELNPTTSSMIDKATELVSTIKESPTETVMDVVGAKVSNQDSSLQGMLEDAIQNIPLAKDGAKLIHEAAAVNLTDTDVTTAESASSGSMKNMQLANFEESLLKKKSSAKGKPAAQTRTLSSVDRKTLQRLKHYENVLWLEFYKVYSVGAADDDESHTLPAFVDILGDDDKGGASTNDESETLPLLVPSSSYNGAAELPTVVIEADFSDEDSDVEEYNQDEGVAKTSRKVKYSGTDPKLNETNLTASATKVTNRKSSIAKHKDVTKHKSLTTNTKAPSSVAAKTDTNSKSPTLDLTSCSDDDDDDKKSFLGSFVVLRPEGLYTDIHEQTNIVMQVTDVTCAGAGFFLYPIIVVLRLLAQLALVPLLMFQVLGTYILICITSDVYCRTTVNQYRLGLDKAALGFTFYCCLLLAILSTAILRWFPCSKRARSAGANCVM